MTFQRNVNFTTKQVRNLANSANVTPSIDPLFFKIEPPRIIDICLAGAVAVLPDSVRPRKDHYHGGHDISAPWDRSIAQELHREMELPGM